MNESAIKRWLDISELADYLGFAEGTIYHWVSKGNIPFCRVGGRLRFDRTRIDEWMYANAYDPDDAIKSRKMY